MHQHGKRHRVASKEHDNSTAQQQRFRSHAHRVQAQKCASSWGGEGSGEGAGQKLTLSFLVL